MKTFRPCLAEFLGTFYLCFAGISAILCNTPAVGGMSGLLGIALAHGLALSIAVNVFGGESGAHFNPAVTAGFLVTGRIAPGSPARTSSRSCSARRPPRASAASSFRLKRSRPPTSASRCRRRGRPPARSC